SPTHDRAGNMLVIPRPSDPRESYTATFDAWHRLVKLEQSDSAGGLATVAEYQRIRIIRVSRIAVRGRR
ncbi:MAG: hypothetical protein U1E05_00405, partial [Patescibacteria group bacterium]|nr:hypothetical protein [Patescibacteria group bacterium]